MVTGTLFEGGFVVGVIPFQPGCSWFG
jgi:hypothetical protein